MWICLQQLESPRSWFFGTPTLDDGQELALGVFTCGNQLDFDHLRIPLVSPGDALPISLAMQTIPVLTDSAADFFLQQLRDDIQLIPCTTAMGASLWVCNVLTVLDCLDYNNTRAEYYPADYPLKHLANHLKLAFEIVLVSSQVGSHRLFRLRADPLKLVTSASFLESLNAAGHIGLEPCAIPRYRCS